MPLVSVVVVTYNSSDCVKSCIESLVQYTRDISTEILVVDNNSADDTVQIIKQFPQVHLTVNKNNAGFASAVNKGCKLASGHYLIILNPDVRFTANTNIAGMVKYYENSNDIGVLAPRLLYPSGEVQESARDFPRLKTFLVRGFKLERFFTGKTISKSKVDYCKAETAVDVDWVLGAFMFIRKDVLRQINYFDDRYFMYYEDIDLCWRLQKHNYKTILNPAFVAIHEYKRESAKKLLSKIKIIHVMSYLRFSFKRIKSG